MMKVTCLVLLVVVSVSWSNVEAKPSSKRIAFSRSIPFKRAPPAKRETASEELIAEIDQLSEESQQKLAKELMAGLLLLTVDSDNSAELDRLSQAFKKAADKHWDKLDDYAAELFKIYEEVTGRKPDYNN